MRNAVSSLLFLLALWPVSSSAQSIAAQPASSVSPANLAGSPRVWIGGDKATLEDPSLRPVMECVARKARELGLTLVDGKQPRQYSIEFSQQLSGRYRRDILDQLSTADQQEEAKLRDFLQCPTAPDGKRCLVATMEMDRTMYAPINELIRQSGQAALGGDVKGSSDGIKVFRPTEETEATCDFVVRTIVTPIRTNQKLLAGAEEQVRATRTGATAMPRHP